MSVLAHRCGVGIRRAARERAVQFLFQYDLNPPSDDLAGALDYFWQSQRDSALLAADGKATWGESIALPPPTVEEVAVRVFAEPLIRGVLDHRAEIDECIGRHADNWDLHRMAGVDRNVLRLAIYEMLHRQDIPPVVSINEAVDIAKRFSTDESGRFVNGLLDKVRQGLSRPARTVAPAA